jgi:protein-S-isoprenylcysteine O-methyltransferase Ste14
MMSLALRTIVFAVLMPATVLVYVPWLILGTSGERPDVLGWRALGLLPLLAGVAVLLLCFAGFILEGRGTPAPYDPPRRLVTGALYRRVRNPMYVGVTTALVGEAIVFGSLALLAWSVVMWLTFHLFVVLYEEPDLRARFDGAYEEYLHRVPRWIPRT